MIKKILNFEMKLYSNNNISAFQTDFTQEKRDGKYQGDIKKS